MRHVYSIINIVYFLKVVTTLTTEPKNIVCKLQTQYFGGNSCFLTLTTLLPLLPPNINL